MKPGNEVPGLHKNLFFGVRKLETGLEGLGSISQTCPKIALIAVISGFTCKRGERVNFVFY